MLKEDKSEEDKQNMRQKLSREFPGVDDVVIDVSLRTVSFLCVSLSHDSTVDELKCTLGNCMPCVVFRTRVNTCIYNLLDFIGT